MKANRMVQTANTIWRRRNGELWVLMRNYRTVFCFSRQEGEWFITIRIFDHEFESTLALPVSDVTPVMAWHLARDYVRMQLGLPTSTTFVENPSNGTLH
jgi:hypothetical protein